MGAFNPAGDLYGYAVSYDWSMGREYKQQYPTNNIQIHVCDPTEVQPRAGNAGNRR